MVSLIVQQLYREILAVADEHGGKLPNRVMIYLEQWKAKEMSVQEILGIYKISESTFFRRLREYSMENK